MQIHIVKADTKISIEYLNLWDKFFFFKENDLSGADNIKIKCNRSIPIHKPNLDTLILHLTKAKLTSTPEYDLHGEFDIKQLTPEFQKLVEDCKPENCDFLYLGIAIKHGNAEKRNIEIRYLDKTAKDQEIVLNIHIDYRNGITAEDAYAKIGTVGGNFKKDTKGLTSIKDVNLENLENFGYKVADQSIVFYQIYQQNQQPPEQQPDEGAHGMSLN